mgnify:CR=1 FL=1
MFYFIEGVSGAGKSTYVKENFGEKAIVIKGDSVKPTTFINGEQIPIEKYEEQHKRRLISLSDIKSQDVVIVGGLLHGIMYDLIGIYELNQTEIIKYIESIIICLPQDSMIIYLETTDLSENVRSILKERYISRPEWIRGIFDYLTRATCCKNQGWKGEDGVIQLMKMIYDYDKAVLREININKRIIIRDANCALISSNR